MPPAVAIIMRSKNEMPHVHTALEMLHKQSVQDFELFAIDSGSTDGSQDQLRPYCDPNHFTEIQPQDYTPGKVLNEAIARTTHPIIVFLNADAIPCSENWLETLIQPIIDQKIDATFSRQIARPDAHFIVHYDYQRAYDPQNSTPGFFSAVACAFKRELWEQHKFQTDGYAEDALWATDCSASGARIQLIPESKVEHSHNYLLKALFRKKFRQGYAFAKTQREISPLGQRLYRCGRELLRDLLFACRKKRLQTIPYNIAYRIMIHAGLHRGIKAGAK